VTAALVICTCGNKFPVPHEEGDVVCPKCKTVIATAYTTENGIVFNEPGTPRPPDPNHHEHLLSLIVDAERTGELKVPIRWCSGCGMVVFEFEKNYVMIPEWSRAKLEAMTKETAKYVKEPPMSVTKGLKGSRKKSVLGRGLNDMRDFKSTTTGGRGLAALFNDKKRTK